MNFFKDMKSKFCLSLIVILGVLYSCTGKSSYILPPDKMEKVLYEYHLAHALGEQNKYENRYKSSLYIQSVLDKNGVTLAQFDSSMHWYSRKLPELSTMYQSIAKRFDAEKTVIDTLVAHRFETKISTLPGDTVDIWSWNRFHRFTGSLLNNYFYYSLSADDNFKKGDNFKLYLSTKYLNQQTDSIDTISNATAGILFTYNNGNRIVKTLSLEKDSVYSLLFESDSLATLVGLNGFFYYPQQTDKRILLIDSISLYRMALIESPTIVVDSLETQNVGADSLMVPMDSVELIN